MPANPKQPAKPAEPKQVQVVESDRQLACARFSPCGKYLFAGGYDAKVHRWVVADDKLTELPPLTGHNGWVSRVAFVAKSKRLLTADTWGALRCWQYDAEAPKLIWSHDQAHDGWVRDVVVSPDGQVVATCGRDRVVRLWSIADGKRQRELSAHNEDVFNVAFHPSGKTLVSGDLKGVIIEWDLATWKPARRFDGKAMYKLDRIQDVDGLRALRFDAKGDKLIAAGTEPTRGATVQGTPTILVFDYKTAKLQHRLQFGKPADAHIEDLHVHRDGYFIAVTSGVPGNGRFVFIRPGDDKPFFESSKMSNCHAVAVHPDGKHLIVTATNRSSNGNGRRLNKAGEYEGNRSPIHLFRLGDA